MGLNYFLTFFNLCGSRTEICDMLSVAGGVRGRGGVQLVLHGPGLALPAAGRTRLHRGVHRRRGGLGLPGRQVGVLHRAQRGHGTVSPCSASNM